MNRNIDYAHFDVDVMEHEKICAMLEDGGAEAWLAWTALIFRARRALDPDNLDRAGIITLPVAKHVLGALGIDAKFMVALLTKHRLLNQLTDDEWILHDFLEHQHVDAWLARLERNRKGGNARAAQLKALVSSKAEPVLSLGSAAYEPRLSTNPTQPIRSKTLAQSGERFDEFYWAYPRHKGKPKAAQAWARAVRRADPDVIIAAAQAITAEVEAGRVEAQYVPYPATWLNRDGWADEPDRTPRRASSASMDDIQWK